MACVTPEPRVPAGEVTGFDHAAEVGLGTARCPPTHQQPVFGVVDLNPVAVLDSLYLDGGFSPLLDFCLLARLLVPLVCFCVDELIHAGPDRAALLELRANAGLHLTRIADGGIRNCRLAFDVLRRISRILSLTAATVDSAYFVGMNCDERRTW